MPTYAGLAESGELAIYREDDAAIMSGGKPFETVEANRTPGGGVQLELPPSARGTSPRSGDSPTRVVDSLVEVVHRWERRRQDSDSD